MKLLRIYFCPVMLLLLLAACGKREEIAVYRLAKAPLETQSAQNPAMPPMDLPSSHPDISGTTASPHTGGVPPTGTGTVPSNWEPQPPSSMRVASFLAKGKDGAVADISLVVLGSAGGGELENVNRWLSQLGQPAITQEQLTKMEQHVATPIGDAIVVDLQGLPKGADALKDGRIVAAMINSEGRTSFYKMRGNSDLVGAQKENFVKWISSVGGGETASNTAAPSQPAPESDKPQIKWEVPEGWNSVPASSMRYASFAAEKNGGKADISVIMFPGDGGGDLENVNRWRQQIGLPAVSEGELKSLVIPIDGKDGKMFTVDMNGASVRVLAGWARHDGRVWFFKMSGPDGLVSGEKKKFEKFLQSVEFHP
jgi:hypothetical protein